MVRLLSSNVSGRSGRSAYSPRARFHMLRLIVSLALDERGPHIPRDRIGGYTRRFDAAGHPLGWWAGKNAGGAREAGFGSRQPVRPLRVSREGEERRYGRAER